MCFDDNSCMSAALLLLNGLAQLYSVVAVVTCKDHAIANNHSCTTTTANELNSPLLVNIS
jgi:hypothetical protein